MVSSSYTIPRAQLDKQQQDQANYMLGPIESGQTVASQIAAQESYVSKYNQEIADLRASSATPEVKAEAEKLIRLKTENAQRRIDTLRKYESADTATANRELARERESTLSTLTSVSSPENAVGYNRATGQVEIGGRDGRGSEVISISKADEQIRAEKQGYTKSTTLDPRSAVFKPVEGGTILDIKKGAPSRESTTRYGDNAPQRPNRASKTTTNDPIKLFATPEIQITDTTITERKKRPKAQQGIADKLFLNPNYITTKQDTRQETKQSPTLEGFAPSVKGQIKTSNKTQKPITKYTLSLTENLQINQGGFVEASPQQPIKKTNVILPNIPDGYTLAGSLENPVLIPERKTISQDRFGNISETSQAKPVEPTERKPDLLEAALKNLKGVKTGNILIDEAAKPFSLEVIGGAAGLVNLERMGAKAIKPEEPQQFTDIPQLTASSEYTTGLFEGGKRAIEERNPKYFVSGAGYAGRKAYELAKEQGPLATAAGAAGFLFPVGVGAIRKGFGFVSSTIRKTPVKLSEVLVKTPTPKIFYRGTNMMREQIPTDVFQRDIATSFAKEQVRLGPTTATGMVTRSKSPVIQYDVTPTKELSKFDQGVKVKPVEEDPFYTPRPEMKRYRQVDYTETFRRDTKLAPFTEQRVSLGRGIVKRLGGKDKQSSTKKKPTTPTDTEQTGKSGATVLLEKPKESKFESTQIELGKGKATVIATGGTVTAAPAPLISQALADEIPPTGITNSTAGNQTDTPPIPDEDMDLDLTPATFELATMTSQRPEFGAVVGQRGFAGVDTRLSSRARQRLSRVSATRTATKPALRSSVTTIPLFRQSQPQKQPQPQKQAQKMSQPFPNPMRQPQRLVQPEAFKQKQILRLKTSPPPRRPPRILPAFIPKRKKESEKRKLKELKPNDFLGNASQENISTNYSRQEIILGIKRSAKQERKDLAKERKGLPRFVNTSTSPLLSKTKLNLIKNENKRNRLSI